MARRFADEGGDGQVVVADVDGSAAHGPSADEIGGHRGRGRPAPPRPATIDLIRTAEEHGPIDLLCLERRASRSAGASRHRTRDWYRTWDINVMAARRGRCGLPPRHARPGRGLHPDDGVGRRTADQHRGRALLGDQARRVALAEWLAITHGDQGLKVSCLCPQGVRTGCCSPTATTAATTSVPAAVRAQGVIEPEDVAAAVVEPSPRSGSSSSPTPRCSTTGPARSTTTTAGSAGCASSRPAARAEVDPRDPKGTWLRSLGLRPGRRDPVPAPDRRAVVARPGHGPASPTARSTSATPGAGPGRSPSSRSRWPNGDPGVGGSGRR